MRTRANQLLMPLLVSLALFLVGASTCCAAPLASAASVAATTPSSSAKALDPIEPDATARRGRGGYPDFLGKRILLKNRLQVVAAEGGRFSARRARLVGRWDHSRWLRTAFEFDLRDGVEARDWVLRWRHHDGLRIWFGQFKSPMSRSILSSSSTLAFIDRSLATTLFLDANPARAGARGATQLGNHGVGRAPGFQIWGDLDPRKGRRFRYYLHATRGMKQNKVGDTWAGAARLEFQPRGDTGFQETTYRIRPFRWSLDVGVHAAPGYDRVDLDGDGAITTLDKQDRTLWSWGGVVRHHRLRLQGEVLNQRANPETSGLATRRSRGEYVHLSWLLMPKTWQLAVRASTVRPDLGRSDQDRHERTVALTRYMGSRANKLILEWRRRWDELRPADHERVTRLFLQLQW